MGGEQSDEQQEGGTGGWKGVVTPDSWLWKWVSSSEPGHDLDPVVVLLTLTPPAGGLFEALGLASVPEVLWWQWIPCGWKLGGGALTVPPRQVPERPHGKCVVAVCCLLSMQRCHAWSSGRQVKGASGRHLLGNKTLTLLLCLLNWPLLIPGGECSVTRPHTHTHTHSHWYHAISACVCFLLYTLLVINDNIQVINSQRRANVLVVDGQRLRARCSLGKHYPRLDHSSCPDTFRGSPSPCRLSFFLKFRMRNFVQLFYPKCFVWVCYIIFSMIMLRWCGDVQDVVCEWLAQCD